MVDENSFYMISLPLKFFLTRTWLSFFFLSFLSSFLFFHMDLHVSNFFLNAWTFMSLYFFNSPCLFCNNRWRERPIHIVELLFCGIKMDGTMLTSHRCIARGVYSVHVNLDHESMKRILPRATTILTKLNAKTRSICIRFLR
jgi:hypothetical protein